jgi:DNA-binding response OmpR family regulator
MPTRILIVDDREADARELSNTMVRRGYDLEVVHNSFKALDIARRWKPQVAILDVNMPGMNGLILSQKLRECADDPIVIFVTSDDSNEMRRLCLESGDDYITKPYDGENLLLRVQCKLRRFDPNKSGALEGSEEMPHTHEPGTALTPHDDAFTPTETRLLNALIAGGGETVSRDELLAGVWGAPDYVNDNTLDRNIRRLRLKTEPDPQHPRIILTVRRAGYRFDLAEWRRARNDQSR